MRTCDGCRFCCYIYGVDVLGKPAGKSCSFECDSGCSIHKDRPLQCADFKCPYLNGDQIHRPDTFKAILRRLQSNLVCIIPWIPQSVPPVAAERLIETSWSILCAVKTETGWTPIVLDLTQQDNLYKGSKEQNEAWEKIIADYRI